MLNLTTLQISQRNDYVKTILNGDGHKNIILHRQDQEKDFGVGVLDRPDIKKEEKVEFPKMWNVWLLNDDYTPHFVVVDVIRVVFGFSEEAATRRMVKAHKEGRAHMGIFTRDVAETKSQQVSTECRRHGDYPLKADIDEAPSP